MRHRLPPPPQPRLGHAAGGAGSRGTPGARNGPSTALFAAECQSFLDNVIACLGLIGAWNGRFRNPLDDGGHRPGGRAAVRSYNRAPRGSPRQMSAVLPKATNLYAPQRYAASCHGTKSLRDSPLRGRVVTSIVLRGESASGGRGAMIEVSSTSLNRVRQSCGTHYRMHDFTPKNVSTIKSSTKIQISRSITCESTTIILTRRSKQFRTRQAETLGVS
jgi:hypothetical protein